MVLTVLAFTFVLILHVYILLAWVSVCLSDSLFVFKIKIAEPIGPKFCVGPWEGLWMLRISKSCLQKI